MVRENRKKIPKRLTGRFSLRKEKCGKMAKLKVKEIGSEKQCSSQLESLKVLFLTEMPELPYPSNELQSILSSFTGEIKPEIDRQGNMVKANTLKKGKKFKDKKKHMNGFMAFRSFYCRSISNVEYQRQLSLLLANIWKEEPSKDIWNRYALEYNIESPDRDFVSWLCNALGFGSDACINPETKVVRNESWYFTSSNNFNAVEDIYLQNSMA